MNTADMFGLTEKQLKLMYSLEYLLTQNDIWESKKNHVEKLSWTARWELALNSSVSDKNAIPFRNEETLLAVICDEAQQSTNLTWLYLVLMEASLFEPYSPLDTSPEYDKVYQKLKYSNQGEYLKTFTAQTSLIDPVCIDRFQKVYSKTLDKLEGKWQKIGLRVACVVAISAIVAATAGVAAGPIAVAVAGSEFAGLSGAALTSACLAMIGGGAVTAGGLGMIGGVAAIVGGGALLGAAGGSAVVSAVSVIAKSSPSFALTQAAKLEVVLKEITLNTQKDIQNAQAVMSGLKEQILHLESELAQMKLEQEADKKAIANMKKSVKYLQDAYKDMLVFQSSFETGMAAGEMN